MVEYLNGYAFAWQWQADFQTQGGLQKGILVPLKGYCILKKTK